MKIGSLVMQDVSFFGSIDELFMERRDGFDALEIRKVWACGIEVERCRCDANSPAVHVRCGRAKPACEGLSDCFDP